MRRARFILVVSFLAALVPGLLSHVPATGYCGWHDGHRCEIHNVKYRR